MFRVSRRVSLFAPDLILVILLSTIRALLCFFFSNSSSCLYFSMSSYICSKRSSASLSNVFSWMHSTSDSLRFYSDRWSLLTPTMLSLMALEFGDSRLALRFALRGRSNLSRVVPTAPEPMPAKYMSLSSPLISGDSASSIRSRLVAYRKRGDYFANVEGTWFWAELKLWWPKLPPNELGTLDSLLLFVGLPLENSLGISKFEVYDLSILMFSWRISVFWLISSRVVLATSG